MTTNIYILRLEGGRYYVGKSDNVMKKIAEGYMLQGGVCKDGVAYIQALVKSNKPQANLLSNNANLLGMSS